MCSAIKAGPMVTAVMMTAVAKPTAFEPPSVALSSTRITESAAIKTPSAAIAPIERRRFAVREASHAVKKTQTASAEPKMIRSGFASPIVFIT